MLTLENLKTNLVGYFYQYIQPHPKKLILIVLVTLGLLGIVISTFFNPDIQKNVVKPSENALLSHQSKPTATFTSSPTLVATATLPPRPTFSPTPTPIVFDAQAKVTPDRLHHGDQFAILGTFISPQPGDFRIYMYVFTESGNKVIDFSKVLTFQIGVPVNFQLDEIVTASDKAGKFRVSVAIANSGGNQMLFENQNAATFTVIN